MWRSSAGITELVLVTAGQGFYLWAFGEWMKEFPHCHTAKMKKESRKAGRDKAGGGDSALWREHTVWNPRNPFLFPHCTVLSHPAQEVPFASTSYGRMQEAVLCETTSTWALEEICWAWSCFLQVLPHQEMAPFSQDPSWDLHHQLPAPKSLILFEREYLAWLRQRFSILFKQCIKNPNAGHTTEQGETNVFVLHVRAGFLPCLTVPAIALCLRHPHEWWPGPSSKAIPHGSQAMAGVTLQLQHPPWGSGHIATFTVQVEHRGCAYGTSNSPSLSPSLFVSSPQTLKLNLVPPVVNHAKQ